ncbi:MAG: hypothetical protein LBL00_06005 [Endomicrobium sp.]|jgi:hypothetical protein|nr:hypothetical protein [Endomicrobium sp.]
MPLSSYKRRVNLQIAQVAANARGVTAYNDLPAVLKEMSDVTAQMVKLQKQAEQQRDKQLKASFEAQADMEAKIFYDDLDHSSYEQFDGKYADFQNKIAELGKNVLGEGAFKQWINDNPVFVKSLDFETNSRKTKKILETIEAGYEQTAVNEYKNAFSSGNYITIKDTDENVKRMFDEAVSPSDNSIQTLSPKKAQELNTKARAAGLRQALNTQILEDPAVALTMLDDKYIRYAINDDEEILRYKTAAQHELENAKYKNGILEVARYGLEANKLYAKFLDKGLTVDEINDAKISDTSKNALFKIAGYDSATYKQNKSNLEQAEAAIELNNMFSNLIVNKNSREEREVKKTAKSKGTEINISKNKIANNKTLLDTMEFNQKVFDYLAQGKISKAAAQNYINNMSGPVFEQYIKIAYGENKEELNANNVFANGLSEVNKKIDEYGITDIVASANIQNTYVQALATNLKNRNVSVQDFFSLPINEQQAITDSALNYTFKAIPNLKNATSVFSLILPKELQEQAQQEYIDFTKNKELTPVQQQEAAQAAAQTVTAAQKQAINKEIDNAYSKTTRLNAIMQNPKSKALYDFAIANPDSERSKIILKQLGLE